MNLFSKSDFFRGNPEEFVVSTFLRAETTLISFHIGDFLRGSEVAVEKITLRI